MTQKEQIRILREEVYKLTGRRDSPSMILKELLKKKKLTFNKLTPNANKLTLNANILRVNNDQNRGKKGVKIEDLYVVKTLTGRGIWSGRISSSPLPKILLKLTLILKLGTE